MSENDLLRMGFVEQGGWYYFPLRGNRHIQIMNFGRDDECVSLCNRWNSFSFGGLTNVVDLHNSELYGNITEFKLRQLIDFFEGQRT